MAKISLEHGSKEWQDIRNRATRSIPGRYSSLYYLNDKILGMGPLVPMTPKAHYAMCLFAEGMTGIQAIDEARVKMLLVPRGIGKSSLITKGLMMHDLLRHDDYAIGIANEKVDIAAGFLAQVRSEFETNTLLRALWPERIPDDFKKTVWASDRIIIKRKKPNPTNPSVLATGVGGTVTGVHMNKWFLDDIISQNAAENAFRGSFTEIEATNRWVGRIQPLLQNPKRDPIIVIGTRWWEGDTYEHIERYFGHEEAREEFLWTLRLPTGEVQTLKVYRIGEIAVFCRPAIENGESIFPERYTMDDLHKMQQEDPVFFAGQYLLAPAAGGAAEFKAEWLRYYEREGKQIRYRDATGKMHHIAMSSLVCFISVDPAISDSKTAARSACPVVGTNGTEIFLLEDFAQQGLGMFDLCHRIIDFYMRYKPRHIFIETVVYQRALVEALHSLAREHNIPEIMHAVQEIRSHAGKSKEFRIYGLEPFFKAGRFYVHRSHTNFIEEYTGFPRKDLRDVIDAVSFQVTAWEKVSAMSARRDAAGGVRDPGLDRYKARISRGGGY